MNKMERISKVPEGVRGSRRGLQLEHSTQNWEVDPPVDFPTLFRALNTWLPENSILCFEDGQGDREIRSLVEEIAIPDELNESSIQASPGPFFVQATKENLRRLTELMEHHAEPELAIHFHVIHDGKLMVEWYDAFTDPMRINGAVVSEETVSRFANALGEAYRREAP
jgi:hypothetical protein